MILRICSFELWFLVKFVGSGAGEYKFREKALPQVTPVQIPNQIPVPQLKV